MSKVTINFVISRDKTETEDLMYCEEKQCVKTNTMHEYTQYSNEKLNILLQVHEDGNIVYDDDKDASCPEVFSLPEDLTKEGIALKVLDSCKHEFCALVGGVLRFCDELSLDDLEWEVSMCGLVFEGYDAYRLVEETYKMLRSYNKCDT